MFGVFLFLRSAKISNVNAADGFRNRPSKQPGSSVRALHILLTPAGTPDPAKGNHMNSRLLHYLKRPKRRRNFETRLPNGNQTLCIFAPPPKWPPPLIDIRENNRSCR